jgi:phenylpropionate dioxygenase-like ring-hydroxylating dioxygenase large terminal subunit
LVLEFVSPASRHDGEPVYQHLNPQYPSSWWTIGFSDEVLTGEVVPATLLERRLMLWRGSDGRLRCQGATCPHLGANIGYGGEVVGCEVRCPFHGFRFDGSGALCHVPHAESTRSRPKGALETYRVVERFGTIFLWNGPDPADHEVPDLVALMAEGRPGLTERDVTCYHHGFYLPYPAKWFLENGPDAGHFPGVHRLGETGSADVLAETPTTLRWRQRLEGVTPYPSWTKLKEQFRRGELRYFQSNAGDVELTTHGGGIQVLALPARVDSGTGRVDEFLRFFESGQAIISWTPVTAETHVFRFVFVLPKIQNPLLRPVGERLIDSLLKLRDWIGVIQDSAIMLHREEPPNPIYVRQDRTLVKFRRFWDRRIADPSLAEGDLVHANGARAGLPWSTGVRRSAVARTREGEQ